MSDDRVPCLECDGAGGLRGVACDRHGPSRIVTFTCPHCGGTGKISPAAVALKGRGEALRVRRVTANESLRETARRFGIPARELGEVEFGTAPLALVARIEELWGA